MARLVGYGLLIESELPIPGALQADPADVRAPDLHIYRDGPAGADVSRPPGFTTTQDGLVCFAPGVAVYRCGRDRIGVATLAGAGLADVAALLVSSALPAVLWMRGAFVLHAATACWPGSAGALAIAGRSGAGKSTLVRQLLELGAQLVGDDTLAIDAHADPPEGRGLPGAIRRAQSDGGDAFDAVPPDRACLAAPLAAVLVLADAGDAWSIDRLEGVEAVKGLLAHRHRPRATLLSGRSGEALRDGARLGARVPVYVWRRPRGTPCLHAGEKEVLTEWLTNRKDPASRSGAATINGSAPRSKIAC